MRLRVWAGIAILPAAALLWRFAFREPSGPASLRGAGDPVTIAATGDSLMIKPLPATRSDPGLEAVQRVLTGASLAVTNLEENLLDPRRVPGSKSPGDIAWPHGTARTAQDLRRLGFNVVSLANNHAEDYGVDGLIQTTRILDAAGLPHAGTGDDLAHARAPVFLGAPPRRVAILAVATSAGAESRATASRGEIGGREGVNALRYAADITVDPATFATLQRSPLVDAASKTDREVTVSGQLIRKGTQTIVNFRADDRDVRDILSQIRQAKAQAGIVIVTIHSHEPGNRSETPAAFLQPFARAAIDAGASLVIGQGPHQLRGIEAYGGGVIFYSLGNFAFDFSEVDPRSEDDYEAGTDLYRLALGAITDAPAATAQSFENAVWWESVIAMAAFDHGVLKSIRLQPIDLGAGVPFAQRGTPRFATGARSNEILMRLAELSRPFGTRLRIENGVGFVER